MFDEAGAEGDFVTVFGRKRGRGTEGFALYTIWYELKLLFGNVKLLGRKVQNCLRGGDELGRVASQQAINPADERALPSVEIVVAMQDDGNMAELGSNTTEGASKEHLALDNFGLKLFDVID